MTIDLPPAIREALEDKSVSDVYLDMHGQVLTKIAGGAVARTGTELAPTAALALIVDVVRISGYPPLTRFNPFCEGWLPDGMPGAGSRYGVQIPPVTEQPTMVANRM
jgi:Flp pilus assembly CpaF family ATPase